MKYEYTSVDVREGPECTEILNQMGEDGWLQTSAYFTGSQKTTPGERLVHMTFARPIRDTAPALEG